MFVSEQAPVPNEIESCGRQGLEFYQFALQSIAEAFEEHDSRSLDAMVLANITDTIRTILSREVIDSVSVRRRVVQPDDDIEEGEHPGSTIQVNYKSGSILYMNISGGLGREEAARDSHDADSTLRVTHTTHTEKILDKATKMNIIYYDSGGRQTFSSGALHVPGESMGIMYAFATTPNTGNKISFEGSLRANVYPEKEENQLTDQQHVERYAYSQIVKRLVPLAKDAIKLTPPPKKT
jgi:hypothetical protein